MRADRLRAGVAVDVFGHRHRIALPRQFVHIKTLGEQCVFLHPQQISGIGGAGRNVDCLGIGPHDLGALIGMVQ